MSESEKNNKSHRKKRKKSSLKPGDSPLPSLTGMKGGGGAMDYMNITPMIDVMLVLLIIFMIITPVVESHSVKLPKTIMATHEKKGKITLTINRQGQFFLQHHRHAIPVNQLTTAIKQQYVDRPLDHVLYLKADEDVSYSVILTAINAARKAGVVRIGAITNPVNVKSKSK